MTRALALVGFLALAVSAGTAAPARAAMDDAAIAAALDARIAAGYGTTMIAGLYDRGRRTFVARGPGASPHTRYAIAGLSSVLTAGLAAVMVGDAEVSWRDPVASAWRGPRPPRLPEPGGDPVTLLDLATHTAGLPVMPGNLVSADRNHPEAAYIVDRLYDFLAAYAPPPAPFGYRYSEIGPAILGQALMQRGGGPFPDLIERRLLAPLGMPDTDFGRMPPPIPGHDENMNALHPFYHGVFDPAAGAAASADDLLTFAAAFMPEGDPPFAGALAASADRLVREPSSGRPLAIGWRILQLEDRILLVGEGASPGESAYLALDRDAGRAVVVLSNGQGLLDDVALAILVPGTRLRDVAPPTAVDPATLERYVGVYAGADSQPVSITRDGTRLYLQSTGLALLALFAESPTHFTAHRHDAAITFDVPAAGRAIGATLVVDGRTVSLFRKD